MTRILKLLTVGLWVLMFAIWIGDLWMGIPMDVSDDVTQRNVELRQSEMERVIQIRR